MEKINGAKVECYEQACNLKCRLRELTSSLCSATALAVCFEGQVAGLDTTETGNEFSQPKFEFTSLAMREGNFVLVGKWALQFWRILSQVWESSRSI